MSKENDILNPFEADENFDQHLIQLNELRKDGESKIIALKNEIRDLKLNKQIDDESRTKLIENDKKLLDEAKVIQVANSDSVKEIVVKAVGEANEKGKAYYQQIKENEDKNIAKAKKDYKDSIEEQKQAHITRLQSIGALKSGATKEEAKAYKDKLAAEKILYKSRIEEVKTKRNSVLDKAKDNKYNAFLEKYGYCGKVRNNEHSIAETLEFKQKHYAYNFVIKDFLLKNALYFIILFFFIICIGWSGGKLLTWNNILGILGQSSTKMFFSLGVAGLILIAGTDLSIGRMTGMAASFACLFVSGAAYDTNIGIIDFSSLPIAVGAIIGLIVCIIACVFFSAIAGFFTAKFKMHPFITTLSTQLLIFGIMMVIFSKVPAFSMDSDFKKNLVGVSGINLILFACAAIVVVWFIWNKTKFGKYMYAVGGNSEAASVSGINVFKVTMGIFVMAGILYGIGGFLEGARTGSANPSTGYGTELDAIAACVVGGISFSGGVGKIKGAVIGTIIFTGLTYCLTYLGLDINFQYIFKGVIIMSAVCLDSLKSIKRK